MFLLQVFSIRSQIYDFCQLPGNKALVLNFYFKPNCPTCPHLNNILENINSKIERSNHQLDIRNVNVEICKKNGANKITPSFTLTENGKELGFLNDPYNFQEVIDFISLKSNIPKSIFKKRIERNPGKVVVLNEHDFQLGLNGPWVVLFYSKWKDVCRHFLKQLAEEYGNRLNVGEISEGGSINLRKRYNINFYPTILGFFDGIIVPYVGKQEKGPLTDFADKLIKPSFQDIDLLEFNKIVKVLEKGHPIFIVFYNDLDMANSYFRKIGHDFKFKATLYKSDNVELKKASSISDLDGTESTKDQVILTVYRDGIFHKYTGSFEYDSITKWIFNSHFPHLTMIQNENFAPLFHGLRTIILLLTISEMHVEKLEKFSLDAHQHTPFTNYLFAVLDIEKHAEFMPILLPGLVVPTLVFFNPYKQKFYYKKIKFDKNTFSEDLEMLIQLFEDEKLSTYPTSSGFRLNLFLIGLGVVATFIIIWWIQK